MLYFAIAYAVMFILMAFRKPLYALFIIWALAPFQTDIGLDFAKFSLTEIHLLMITPLVLLRMRQSRSATSLGALAVPITIFLGISLLSSLFNWRGSVAVNSMIQMVLYIVLTVPAFSSLVSPEELRRVPYGLIYTGAVWSMVGIVSHFNFLDHSKNAFGASLAAAFLVAMDLWLSEPKGKKRNFIFVAGSIILLGLILSLSRGGWLGAISGFLVIVWLRRAWRPVMKGALLAVPLILIAWHTVPEKSREYALSVDSSRFNIKARYESLQLAQDNFYSDPILGVGVGLRKQYDATNVLWTTLAETGVLGTLAFLSIFVAFYRLVGRTRKKIKVSDPCFSLLSIGAALMTCKLMHGMVDHYWTRGSITLAWGGAGMVLAASRLPAHRALEAARAAVAQKRVLPGRKAATRPLPIHAYAPLISTTEGQNGGLIGREENAPLVA